MEKTRMQKANRQPAKAHPLRAVESRVLGPRTAGGCKLAVNQTQKERREKGFGLAQPWIPANFANSRRPPQL